MEIAALRLAASIVSPIFTKLGDKAVPYFGGDITDGEVQHLQNILLPKFRTVLRMAEAVPVYELEPLLRMLQTAAYEAEDVLDMYEYKRLEAKVSSLPDHLKKLKKKAKDFVAPSSLKTELKKCMEKLQQSADEADKLISLYGTISQTLLPRDIMKQQQQQPTTGLLPPSPVFGRDKERDLLVDMLILTTSVEHSGSPRHTPVLAICGLGGAGKTTLAQCIYNNSSVVQHFDTMLWVHVSHKFDVHRITTEIIQHLKEQGEGSYESTCLNVLQMKLKDLLISKKFLLVLDDVWCQDSMQWDQMLAPLNEVCDSRSRILVTTRTQEIALRLGIENIVPLNDLDYEDCLSIFKHYSFGDANIVIDDPELATVVEQIMKTLKKSPLSARMIGSLLRGNKNVVYWNHIFKRDEMLKDTLNALHLSFVNLAPHLQRCFAYCSLYPKGHHFPQMEVDKLVRFWIAQGFVEAPYNNNMTIEDMGMQYFNELVSNSFFQKHTKVGDIYVVHDLLHDLAEDVSKGHCFRIEDDNEDIPTTVSHLSICTEDLPSHIPPYIFKLVNLRTFMVINNMNYVSFIYKFEFGEREQMFQKFNFSQKKMFKKFKKLRVLHLGYDRWPELHKSIDQLIHLRYLQLKVFERLPRSLGRLYHLQFLDHRSRGYLIGRIPENLNKLIKLRYLHLHPSQETISEVLLFGKLTSLQKIENYNASRKKGHGIGQLKNLQQLRGSLSINKLQNVQDKAEASEASLKEKKLLEELTLSWTCSPERVGGNDEEVLKGLEPPPNLNVLRIYGYNGIGFPEWLLNDGRFLCLSELSINSCHKLERVPSLPGTLKLLEVFGCENLNEMSSLPSSLRVVRVDNCPKLMQLSPFPPNLEELGIDRCPGVETLLSNFLLFEGEYEHPNHEQQEKDNQQHFPLKELTIKSCSVSGKKRLLSDPNKLFTSLTRLYLEALPWLSSLFHPDHKLTSLEDTNIINCENLAELFGSSSASSSSLRCLKIYNCPRLRSQLEDESVGLLPSSLEELIFHNCGDPEMNLLRRCLIGLSSLRRLEIGGYSHARSLPDLANPGALTYLWITDCPELTSMSNLHPLSSLEWLCVMGCPKLTIGVGRERLPPSFKHMTIDDLSLLTVLLPRREFLNSLKELRIKTHSEGIAFTEEELFRHLSSLTHLLIEDCPNLTSLPANIEKLSSLRNLVISDCPKMELLPNLPSSLEKLCTWGCHPQLILNYRKDGPLRHNLQHITRVIIL